MNKPINQSANKYIRIPPLRLDETLYPSHVAGGVMRTVSPEQLAGRPTCVHVDR